MRRSGITVAVLLIAVATSAAAQVSIDEQYLAGTWVGEWVLRGPDPSRPSAVKLRDTLTFTSDGKFVRAIQAADNPGALTTRQEGTYTITGNTIWIRGTYDSGERAGQTTSIALKVRGETLEASINPASIYYPKRPKN